MTSHRTRELVVDDACRARAAELGVDATEYRLWEAGFHKPDVADAVKRGGPVQASEGEDDGQERQRRDGDA